MADTFLEAVRAAMHDPANHPSEPDFEQIVRRVIGHHPTALTVIPGRPLSEAILAIPARYDFCRQCGLDLLSNPDTRVASLTQAHVHVACNCGIATSLPRWLFE